MLPAPQFFSNPPPPRAAPRVHDAHDIRLVINGEEEGSSSGTHTQMAWEVADIDATVAALRARGVVFEEYDLPGFKTVNGIAEIEGNYPS